MNVYWLQPFWFGEVNTGESNLASNNFLKVDLDKVNTYATIGLTLFSPGFDLNAGVNGLAAAGIKSYEYIDAAGNFAAAQNFEWQSHLYVKRCLSITFAFAVRRAWAKAEGMIHYYND